MVATEATANDEISFLRAQNFRLREENMVLQQELSRRDVFQHVVDFHNKFGLQATDHPNYELPTDVTEFRLSFLLEELAEYAEACGYQLNASLVQVHTAKYDSATAFDSLIDLVYVAFGDLFLRRFPFNDGWLEVHRANMSKVRADSGDDARSKRKHSCDVVKPEGWTPPDLTAFL